MGLDKVRLRSTFSKANIAFCQPLFVLHIMRKFPRVKNAVPKAISYGLADENETAVLADDIEVRTYPSMRALFLQKHEHEEEKRN